MPILVNGEPIPAELIRDEERRLALFPYWQAIPDGLDKSMQLRQAAEALVIDRILLRQAATRDQRAIDPAIVAAEVARLSASQSCRVIFDESPLARQIEDQLRLDRTMRDLMGPIAPPTNEEIARVYRSRRRDFQRPDVVHAAHIVKFIDETHTEESARDGIEAALEDLNRGEAFAEVAARYSDCAGDGDLGSFERGVMVEGFDAVVFAMKPGERSPIFRTPFGFHIAEVRARSGGGIADLREVRDTIREFLTGIRRREAAHKAAARLRDEANIQRTARPAPKGPA